MSKVEDFLTKEEEQAVVEAIRVAEKNTSGEIRVHIVKPRFCVGFHSFLINGKLPSLFHKNRWKLFFLCVL